jgi:hypothetical protein
MRLRRSLLKTPSIETDLTNGVVTWIRKRIKLARTSIQAGVVFIKVLDAGVDKPELFRLFFGGRPCIPFRAVTPVTTVIEIVIYNLQLGEMLNRPEMVNLEGMKTACSFVSFVQQAVRAQVSKVLAK